MKLIEPKMEYSKFVDLIIKNTAHAHRVPSNILTAPFGPAYLKSTYRLIAMWKLAVYSTFEATTDYSGFSTEA